MANEMNIFVQFLSNSSLRPKTVPCERNYYWYHMEICSLSSVFVTCFMKNKMCTTQRYAVNQITPDSSMFRGWRSVTACPLKRKQNTNDSIAIQLEYGNFILIFIIFGMVWSPCCAYYQWLINDFGSNSLLRT